MSKIFNNCRKLIKGKSLNVEGKTPLVDQRKAVVRFGYSEMQLC